jgi:hypothetical protein
MLPPYFIIDLNFVEFLSYIIEIVTLAIFLFRREIKHHVKVLLHGDDPGEVGLEGEKVRQRTYSRKNLFG